jgi:hypothetical protein
MVRLVLAVGDSMARRPHVCIRDVSKPLPTAMGPDDSRERAMPNFVSDKICCIAAAGGQDYPPPPKLKTTTWGRMLPGGPVDRGPSVACYVV